MSKPKKICECGRELSDWGYHEHDPNFRICECGAVYWGAEHKDCPKRTKNLPMPDAEHLGRVEPMHRRDDKSTSVPAAEAFDQERLTELQVRVLEFFRARKGATDEELEDALMGLVPAASTLRKRRCELVSLGYLRDSGRTRKDRNNREMVVWEVVGEGEEL